MSRPTTRTSTKDLLPEVNLIKEKTGELKSIVNHLPDSRVKDAFVYSVKNLEKKIKDFTAIPPERIFLTDEEKELIRIHRAQTPETKTEDISEIPTTAGEILKKKLQKKH